MKILATFVTVILFAFPAYAGEKKGQLQGQAQGQLQGQLQGQKASVQNSGSTVSVEGDEYDPPAYAPNVSLTSSNCIGSVAGSGGGMGLFSFGLGITRDHEDCFKIEVYKALIGQGRRGEADRLMNSISWYKDAMQADTSSVTSASFASAVSFTESE